jgi:DNA polymerase III sliding clamp (beta) subunit (PCNA family)
MIVTFADSVEFAMNLKAALRAACEDLTRAHMCCVLIEIGNGVARFVGTNGHWLWVNDVRCHEIVGIDAGGKEILAAEMGSAVVQIHRDDAREILRGLEKGKKARMWVLTLDTEKREVVQLGSTIRFRLLNTTYPPYQQIIPTSVAKKTVSASFDTHYIAEIAAAFEDVAYSKEGGVGISLEPFGTDYDPVLITSPKSSALAILMQRSEDKHGTALAARYTKPVARAA